MGSPAKLLNMSSAICFGIYVLAALAPLCDAQYVISDGELLLDLDKNSNNGSRFGDFQIVSMAPALAFLVSGYAAGRNHKPRTEVAPMAESTAPIKAGITADG
jgi:hypothetical protein